jgi:hypothetical protein
VADNTAAGGLWNSEALGHLLHFAVMAAMVGSTVAGIKMVPTAAQVPVTSRSSASTMAWNKSQLAGRAAFQTGSSRVVLKKSGGAVKVTAAANSTPAAAEATRLQIEKTLDRPTVLVSEKLGEAGLELLRKMADVDCSYNLTQEELCAKISSCDALIVRSGTKVTREVFKAANGRLKVFFFPFRFLNHVKTPCLFCCESPLFPGGF